jgi:uncharacterized membrane protein
MTYFAALFHKHPIIFWHLVSAVSALIVGAYLLARKPRGDTSHRRVGWLWVGLMASATVSSGLIRDFGMLNVLGYTPIHLLTVFVAIMLPYGVLQARQHNIAGHRKAMRGMYIGGCIVAGLFTLMPGRFLGNLLWKQWLQVL